MIDASQTVYFHISTLTRQDLGAKLPYSIQRCGIQSVFSCRHYADMIGFKPFYLRIRTFSASIRESALPKITFTAIVAANDVRIRSYWYCQNGRYRRNWPSTKFTDWYIRSNTYQDNNRNKDIPFVQQIRMISEILLNAAWTDGIEYRKPSELVGF